jgi:4-hydroxy-tetrahydrodipicolinate reductase
MDADCVLYMPRLFDVEDVVALLASGKNVVTTRGELFAGGHRLRDEHRTRIIDACAEGHSSISATGSSPGFITDALPLALLSMQRRVDAIVIDEFADLSRRDSPHMLFRQMGFGQSPDAFDARRSESLLGEFGPPLAELASAAGRPVDDWTCTGEVAVAGAATRIVAGDIGAGTIAAQRTVIAGLCNGDEVVRFAANWYCTTEVEPEWELRPTGWRVRVHGDAPFDVDLTFPVPLEVLGSFTPAYTANRPVNAIAYVCAAAPGILSTADLPPITPVGHRD